MSSTNGLLLGIALGAGAVSAAWLAFGGQPSPLFTEQEPVAAPAAPATELAPRLTRIEEALHRLTREVERMRGTSSTPTRVVEQERVPTASDATALANAIDRAQQSKERARIAKLTDAELFAEARKARRDQPQQARDLLAALMRRPLNVKQRTEALTALGALERKRGNLRAAETALTNAVQAGANTPEGAWASYELALTVSDLGDHARALAITRPIETTPGLTDYIRLHGAWAKATLTEKAGDPNGARVLYEQLIANCKDKDGFQWLVDDLTRRLRR